MKKFKTPSFIIPALFSLFFMCLIFVLSAQHGEISSALSIDVTETAARIIFSDFDAMTEQVQETVLQQLHGIVRKSAHFCIFFMLGISVFLSVRSVVSKISKQFIITISICTVYAIFDEVHQFFVPGRDANVTDVIIDVAGSLCGIIVVFLISSTIKHIKISE
jgi:VanZ family protein